MRAERLVSSSTRFPPTLCGETSIMGILLLVSTAGTSADAGISTTTRKYARHVTQSPTADESSHQKRWQINLARESDDHTPTGNANRKRQ